MASFVAAAAMRAASHPPPATVALSGVFGSISLVAWICVILPQLFTNFKAKSADGLSMAFLTVWVLGDATNLAGALLTHLAPTAVILPSYFVLADLVLIMQCVYYNRLNERRKARLQHEEVTEAHEDSPLLRRSSSSRHHDAEDPTSKLPAGATDTQEGGSQWANNVTSLLAVYAIGCAAWFISYKAGAWDIKEPTTPEVPEEVENPWEIAGLTLGYVSAVCYLCARVPQIVKNYKEKSCEGLALLFFMLSLTGNLTYGVSLLAYSQEKKYLLNALPFLLGSVGTIVEDCIIFVQFRLYADGKRPKAV